MIVSQAALWSLVLANCHCQFQFAAAQQLAAFQSGPKSASTYAGGMALDVVNNRIFITGATYEVAGRPTDKSDCFVGMMSATTLKLLDQDYDGMEQVDEACIAIDLRQTGSNGKTTFALLGISEPGGSDIITADGASDTTSVQHGLLNQLLDQENGDFLTNIHIGQSIKDFPIVYPQSMTNDGFNVYVASMVTQDTTLTGASTSGDGEEYPNYTSGGVKKYGSSYDMLIQKWSPLGFGFKEEWSASFTDSLGPDGSTSPTVYVGGMLLKDNQLLVVGNTKGIGLASGDQTSSSVHSEDGFITKLDTATGDLYEGADSILNVAQKNDAILTHICDDPNDPNAFFVVGATRSDDNLFPLIAKISLDTLTEVWSQVLRPMHLGTAIGVPATAYALSCQVHNDIVYMAGNVEDGAFLLGAGSFGDDDVFVAQFSTSDGTPKWVKQVGSSQKDQLAHGGGLLVDPSTGNAIIYGDTAGNLFREKSDESHSDIFVLYLSKVDGSHAATVSGNGNTSSNLVPPTQEEPQETPPASLSQEGFATQIAGPIYAGGLNLVAEKNSVYFTGALYQDGTGKTYDSSECFLGLLNLEDGSTSITPLGNTNTPEACSAMTTTMDAENPSAFLVGGTEKGGLLTDLEVNQGIDDSSVKQFGLMLQVPLHGRNAGQLSGGSIMTDGTNPPVTYPVAIVTDDAQEHVFVASVASEDASKTSDAMLYDQDEYPDLTSGGYRRYGYHFQLRFCKHAILTSPLDGDIIDLNTESMSLLYDQIYETDDGSSVYTTGMATVGDYVVVVGSTRGSGGIFGTSEGSDMDGFVVKLNQIS
jgi:hypothetical protein